MSLGTRAQAMAYTILALCLAIPPRSASVPTMKPGMFCRNSSGTPRWLASSMKCAPFRADSASSAPLLARMATGWPWIAPKPVTSVSPHNGLNSWKALPSSSRAMISRAS
ncbi:hypothetical protein Y695_04425 [Hydrogenophaga sp. T4]|nr:hypothetical protein Y695_04425 [Hydrogenophaga sp. T4]